MPLKALNRTILLCLLLTAQLGCTFSEVRRQADEIESASSVSGKVIIESERKGQVFVQAYRYTGHSLEMLRHQPAQKNGEYKMNLLPGRYAISAFIDENDNAVVDQGEHGFYPGMESRYPLIYNLSAKDEVSIPAMTIKSEIQPPSDITVTDALSNAMKNTGTVTTLDNPMFAPKNARMALWRPMDFAEQFGGGVLFLEPYDAQKIPLLFVHGIGGSAREFSDIIATLDRQRFQPWVYQYPSGLSLGLVSDFLGQALSSLHAIYNFPQLVLVAHSMGGLLSRDFVLTHAATEAPFKLALVMTINSPLHGIDSAAKGIKVSPIIIPSWRDVATGSAFILNTHAKTWPKDVPYHLVFSYLPGKDGDGVVPVSKQLSRSLQREARAIHGFEAGHAKILREPEFIELLNSTINNVKH